MTFLLLSWLMLEISRDRFALRAGIMLGISIWSKTWPIIFAPIALLRLQSWRARLLYIIPAGLIPLFGIALFELIMPGNWQLIVSRALRAGASPGWYGYSALLNVYMSFTGDGAALLRVMAVWGTRLGFASGLIVILLTRKSSSLYSLMATILVMYSVSPAIGLQGFTWIIPIGVIMRRYNALTWFIAGCLFHMLISYWGIHLTDGLYRVFSAENVGRIIQLSSLTIWGTAIIWAIQELSGRNLLPYLFTKKSDTDIAHPN
jgi:hypothetical protein